DIYGACEDADIVIDTSDFFVKKLNHLININEYCKQDTIFALNISNKEINKRTRDFDRKKKIIGIHFYSPFINHKRVDIIKLKDTSNETVNLITKFLNRINVKIRFYKTDLLDFTIYRKINHFSNKIQLFKDQLTERSHQGKVSIKKNLRQMSKYYYQDFQKIIGKMKTPSYKLKESLFRYKIRFIKFINRKKDEKKLMINLGGGIFFRKHWRVLDKRSYWYKHSSLYVDYFFDLAKNEPFPFEDNSVQFFYSSGCFEHIPQEFSQNNFNEIYRCLVPGGAVRIQTPDFDLAYEAYGKNDEDIYKIKERRGKMKPVFYRDQTEAFICFFASYFFQKEREVLKDVEKNYKSMKKEDFANYYTERIPREWQEKMVGGHINWYNYEKLERMLKIAGFKKIYRSEPQKSKFPEMRGGKKIGRFDATESSTGVFVEAVK
ncbi:MAG: 3-hydroxyacyl-CoA dehydrogenase NAD-binding domain-containing protein, partial [Promethearchaeota archaeon]